MSEITNNLNQQVSNIHGLNKQVYNIHDGDTLLSQAEKVICVLMPRGLVAGGFSQHGELLMLRYNEYKKDLPTWILDFFEHQFIDEPLLANPDKMTALYIATEKSMIVPNALYDEQAAEEWMKKIFFIESNELIASFDIKNEEAQYIYSWSAAVQSLVTRYYPGSQVYPLSRYQFYKPLQSELSLQCCITYNQVYATFYKQQKLQWHQIFYYETAEDIAYQLKLLCQQNDIDEDQLSVQCLAVNQNLTYITTALSQYFTVFTDGVLKNERGTSWNSTILLLQQLYACVL